MSEQDQDAIVGRLIREKSAALRRKAALDAELKMIGETICRTLDRVNSTPPEVVAGMLESVKKYFSADALLNLLKERIQTQQLIVERTESLRDLGVND